MSKAVEFPIYADNGGLFCKCRNYGEHVELEGAGGKIIKFSSLQMAVFNPKEALKSRGQKPKKQRDLKE